jgi:hypothetical protein
MVKPKRKNEENSSTHHPWFSVDVTVAIVKALHLLSLTLLTRQK